MDDHQQMSDNSAWRPYHPNYGVPTVGHVREMHPYPYRRYSQHEEAGLVPQLHPSNVTTSPGPATTPPPTRAPSAASATHSVTGTARSVSNYRADTGHHRSNSNAATMASSYHHHQPAPLGTVREDDDDDDEDGNGGRKCCFCINSSWFAVPNWARKVWEWMVYNRCLVYGLIAAVVCTIVFGIVFGVVIPRLSSGSSGASSNTTSGLPTATGTPTTTEASTTRTPTPTNLPTDLPDECKPDRWTHSVSWMGIAGASGGWKVAFSSEDSAAECCNHCFNVVPGGCNGWQFTPGSSTPCTVIHSWPGRNASDKEKCPNGNAGVAFRTGGTGADQDSAGGAGPCGSVSA